MAEHSTTERELAHDLSVLGDMVEDESFYTELYKGLAGVRWARDGEHITLSWKRAEEVVNALRAQHDRDPLELAQTGGEGQVSERVAAALGTTGWTARPLDAGRHDDGHVDSPHDAPPRGGTHRAD
jgi:hypothetical protein